MKKSLILLTLFTQTIFAEAYTALNYGTVLSEDSTFFDGAESLNNVVGAKTIRKELEVGITSENNDKKTDIFFYAWNDGKEKYNETGVGLGGRIGISYENRLAFSIGAKSGVGAQSNNGKTFMTQSGLSNASFVTGYNATHTPTIGTFTRDTAVFEINLITEMNIHIVKHLDVNLQMTYLNSYYQFEYRVPSGIASQSGVSQDSLLLSAGLKYLF